jgi:hypothetical protein
VEEDDCSVSFTLGQVLLGPPFFLVTMFFVQESCGNSLQISQTKGNSFAAHWYQTDPLSFKESDSLKYKIFLTVLFTDLITLIWIVLSSPVNYEYVVIMPCLFFVFHMSLLQT